MGIGSQARLAAGAIGNAGQNIWRAVKGLKVSGLQNSMSGAMKDASAAASASTGFWGNVSRPVASSASAGLWVAKKPLEAGLYGIRKAAEFVGKHPLGSLITAGVAAAAGVGLWARNRAERDTMESYQQAAMQMQAMRSPYMNSVTPPEYAAMEARMRQGGDGGSSMAQAEQQRRAAAQQAAAPAAS